MEKRERVIAHNVGEKYMKKTFETPIVKIIAFEAQDVLAAGSSEPSVDNTGSTGNADDKPFWSGSY